MNILLIDADSQIPNIALMKISTYYKRKTNHTIRLRRLGLSYYPTKDKTSINISDITANKIYCSIIFDTNKTKVIGNNVDFGGTGVSLKKTLPKEIEECVCDYSLYPENKISYGFISRGCIRNCWFCKVPKKEGMIRQVNNIDDIVKHKTVKFMDNNFLALPNHKELLNELIDKKIKCSFNQGLDIRLLNEENSTLLSKLKYQGEYFFAFDDWKDLKVMNEKLKLLGWRRDFQIKFFIYCHPKNPISEIIKRVEWCRENKCLPYIMRDITCYSNKCREFYVDIASYCNQPSFFKKMSFDEFLGKRHTNLTRIKKSSYIYKTIKL